MIEIKEEFKYRLEKALADKRMKPAELAKATGISEATISQYRSGYSKPKYKRLALIANTLGVNPAWLMGIDVPMSRTPAVEKAEQDIKVIQKFSRLSNRDKELILGMMDSMIAGSISDAAKDED